MRFEHETLLADALYNVHENSGASDDYSRGVVLGVVSALMAVSGDDFKDIVPIVAKHLPINYKDDRLPTEAWANEFRKEWQRILDKKTEQARPRIW